MIEFIFIIALVFFGIKYHERISEEWIFALIVGGGVAHALLS